MQLRAIGRTEVTMLSNMWSSSVGGLRETILKSSLKANRFALVARMSAIMAPSLTIASCLFSCCWPFASSVGIPLSVDTLSHVSRDSCKSRLQVRDIGAPPRSLSSSFTVPQAARVKDKTLPSWPNARVLTGSSAGKTAKKPSKALRTPCFPSTAGSCRSAFCSKLRHLTRHSPGPDSATSSYAAIAVSSSISFSAASTCPCLSLRA
mmetsp:Transcript_25911/g.59854  ORF Transcript_25911/g.59854 Transcript_25911/m.59854 type:complete len:207 (+) Transcript_25911:621-1241(+)